MIGKVEASAINRKRRKAMVSVLEVVVTTNITHIKTQQTNPLKMTKKNTAYTSWTVESENEKKASIFDKIRPYKQRKH